MKFELYEAILHTATSVEDMRAEYPDVTEEEIQVYEKIFAASDGRRAIVSPSFSDQDTYAYMGLLDPVQHKEVSYLMEQDPYMGCFIDQREEFDRVYGSGDYCPDGGVWTLKKEYVEIVKLISSAEAGEGRG